VALHLSFPNTHYATRLFVVWGFSHVHYEQGGVPPGEPCQKYQCVWCVNDATQEAVPRQGNMTAIARCCDDPKYMGRSAEMCERTVGGA